ncbi:putative membrane protein [Streptomyces sp. 1114.5]|uniref:SHOCT domain-containing protein n=1 Tax=Streptomyces sp. 1114.5 TaxID=1938830 RepID=UPI000EB3E5F9|nr:SHOCT domain-containing protein [Streptomyces sp. 1114.5]RKT18167.1 putative membrane protein [Streptomyces sp. 1114.5]
MYTQLADWHGPGPWILLVPLIWITVVFLVILALRRTVWRRRGCGFGYGAGAAAEHPLAVLGRRYAEGDIDAEEYRARRAVLSEPSRDDARGGGGGR